MCGIAGFVSTDPLSDDAAHRAIAMRDVLIHRGPDAEGLHVDRYAALAHRRLSIVDLKTGGQPLSNEDGTIWIVYNGEIYNHASLRTTLESRGHRYRTTSDTESIVHAYEEWGDDCVEQLRGMFAFAIWDAPRRRLLLARDRLGIKPLYWSFRGGTLYFASEIKSLLASHAIPREPNLAAVPELLGTRFISGAATLFRNVWKLLPAHLLVLDAGRTPALRTYWDLPTVVEPNADRSAGARAAVEFRERLEESVRLRLMSDVPLGVLLSGGIDSSAIAAIMAKQIDRQLQTFSVAFEERAFSELEYAREVAHAIGAKGHEVVVSARDFFGALPTLLWHEDEPIAHPSSVPLYFVSALARRHVTVVLTGEGSDELLAGYGKYPRTMFNWRAGGMYDRVVPPAVRRLIRHTVTRTPGRLGRRARRTFLSVEHTSAAQVFDNFAAVALADQRTLLSTDLRSHASTASAYGASLAYFDRPSHTSTFLDRLLYADMKTYLVELLMKQDQMSMAASLESRVPFLDHKLVEFAAQLPDSWKLSGWTTKRVLRESMNGVLPASILRRPKMGFPVPFASWTRGPWSPLASDVLLDRRSTERGLLDARAVASLLRGHARGTMDGGDRIWSLLNLELWFRTFIDGDGVQTLPGPARAAGGTTSSTLPSFAPAWSQPRTDANPVAQV